MPFSRESLSGLMSWFIACLKDSCWSLGSSYIHVTMWMYVGLLISSSMLSLEYRVSNSVCSMKQGFRGTLQSIFRRSTNEGWKEKGFACLQG